MAKLTWDKPVVVCMGEDEYSMNKWIRHVIAERLPEEERQFGLTVFQLRDQSLMEAVEEADMVSWLGNQKVVWIREAVFLTAGGARAEQSVDAASVERLMDYLKSPNPGTLMIIEVQADKLDERKKIVKQIKEQKLLLDFKPKDEKEIRLWLEEESRKRDLPIEVSALRVLQERCGSNFRMLETELEKFEIYLAGRKKLMSVEEVERLVPVPIEDDVFQLTEALIQFKFGKAIELINDLIRMKQEPVRMAMLLVTQFRTLILSLELSGQGFSSQQIAGKIGGHPYAVQKMLQSATKSKLSIYQRMLAEFLKLDSRLKRTGIDQRAILEDAILRIAVAG